ALVRLATDARPMATKTADQHRLMSAIVPSRLERVKAHFSSRDVATFALRRLIPRAARLLDVEPPADSKRIRAERRSRSGGRGSTFREEPLRFRGVWPLRIRALHRRRSAQRPRANPLELDEAGPLHRSSV